MKGLKYLCEICKELPRCGPGNNASTRRAFNALPNVPDQPLILDIGCGTGMPTIELARICNGTIYALDNQPDFLNILMKKAGNEGLEDRMIPKHMSMTEMDFEDGSFDIIWSEGSLFCMGFREGLRRCHELLKDSGCMAVTDLVRLYAYPPHEALDYYQNAYPDITGIRKKIKQIQKEGYRFVTYFALPQRAWLENYYSPMEKLLPEFKDKYKGNQEAMEMYESLQKEIEMYKKYAEYFGYAFFIVQKISR